MTEPSIEFSMGTMPRSTSPLLDRGDHVRDVAERHRLARGEVGLREQRLLRERAVRPEEADPSHRRRSAYVGVPRASPRIVHSRASTGPSTRPPPRCPTCACKVQRIRELLTERGAPTRATGTGTPPRRRDRRRSIEHELARARRHHRARDPERGLIDFPARRAVGRDLPALLARRRGRHRLVALARRRLRRPHAAHATPPE